MKVKKIIIFILAFILLFILYARVIFLVDINSFRYNKNNMQPAYNFGDMLFYSKEADYKIGDAIIYPATEGDGITRIIGINEDGTFLGKGDNFAESMYYEKNIRKESIYGKVVFRIKDIIFFLLIIVGFVLLIVIALLITKLICLKFCK